MDQMELISPLTGGKTKDIELPKSFNRMESEEPAMDAVTKDASVPWKVAGKYPPRRTVSAVRDYPIGWSNVTRLSNESLKDTSADNDNFSDKENKQPKQMVEARITGENVQDDLRSNLKRSVMKNFVENVRVASDRDVLKTNAGHRPTAKDVKSQVTSNKDGSHTNPSSSVPRSPHSSLSVNPVGRPASNNDNVVTRDKVKKTLRLFQETYRKATRDEESKVKVPGTHSKRIDLVTVNELKKKDKWVNTGGKIVGHIPGVEVGDEFQFRVELSMIGLHGPFQSGIDFLNKDGKYLATSVVSCGVYDDIDNFDVLVYSGHGGKPSGENKKAEDQKLQRGNLALKNSVDERTPVRVIRGFKEMKRPDSLETKGKTVTTYTYDGLYLAERYWQEKGRHGNNVYMFELRRIPGQPELALREVQKSRKLKVCEGLCVDDISQGQEKMRICAVNTVDSEKPPQFKYITKMEYPSRHNVIPLEGGCGCKNGCSDSKKCLCAVKNGGDVPFNHNGALVELKHPQSVYECGPHCKCPPSCRNRVSQHGIKFQLEIFKTKSKGWGVRSLNSIPSGSFICEYTGEVLSEKEADQRTGNDEYLYDLGRIKSSNQTLCDDLQSTSISEENVEDEEGLTIDARGYGNVSRFINHSCSPNVVAQNVLYDHDDKRMPHIMLFSADNIPPLQELTYDYNYTLGSVHDSEGNLKIKECYCGSTECRKRMY
ncbi:histone-lysine N-methyltransferase, H3 lysine-9 specific SUVH5-like [Papaver somniferum]|nr:histone-lysine N-methyltransferase, H3 lysine-9 specific SUVH5-like [Papaver somniferum]